MTLRYVCQCILFFAVRQCISFFALWRIPICLIWNIQPTFKPATSEENSICMESTLYPWNRKYSYYLQNNYLPTAFWNSPRYWCVQNISHEYIIHVIITYKTCSLSSYSFLKFTMLSTYYWLSITSFQSNTSTLKVRKDESSCGV